MHLLVLFFIVFSSLCYAADSTESVLPLLFYQALRPAEKETPPPSCVPIVGLRHIEGGGVGYNQGYTTNEGLFLAPKNPAIVPFADLRAHVFDNGEYAANAGLGFRHSFYRNRRMVGAHVYYDFRSDHHRQFFFNQMGVGIEWLSHVIDLRLDGYFPCNNRKNVLTRHVQYEGGYFIRQKVMRVAFQGGNFEVGKTLVKNAHFVLYGGIGPYYYGGNVCCDIRGGRLRLNMTIQKHLLLEGSISYDNLFKTRVQGSLVFRFFKSAVVDQTKELIYHNIERNEIIVLDKNSLWEWNY